MTASKAANGSPGELIVLCDAADAIRFVNRNFVKLFGADAPGWHGRSFAPSDVGAPGETRTFKTTANTPNGEAVVDWRLETLPSGERLYEGLLINSEPDMAASEEIDAGAESKIQFVAAISHEMRTPLNGILGMSALLLDTDLTPNQRAYVEAVRQSGASLLALTNDILDFSKLDAGKIEFEDSPYDPYNLVQSVTEILSPKAAEKGIEIAGFIDPATPRKLRGDEARVRQILLNLASNAVKFTKSGGVAIELHTERSVEGVTLIGDVRDTGVGIAREAQASIFEKYMQADRDAERRAQGTGLGLAISRGLARAMGGDISFKSKEGKGSVFTFSVRAGPSADTGAMVRIDAPPIVVATTSPILARVFRLQLQSFGVASFRFASDLKEAAFALQEMTGSLLLCDNALTAEYLDGAIAAATRALVLLSPNERNAIDDLRSKGFDGYLIKPIRQSTLMREIARGGRRVEAAPTVTGKQTPQPSRPLRILLAEDNQINAILATTLMRRDGHKVDVAHNGEEAVAAAATGVYDIIFMDMHMPVCDGVEASRRVRALASDAASVPIVALTANAMPADRQKCIAAGMNDFLSKPFEPSDIQEMLAKWVDAASKLEAAS